jgi:hypothetical protein
MSSTGNAINNKNRYKEHELDILRVLFVIAAIVAPIITYLLASVDNKSNNSIYLGWFMSIIFSVLFVLSYKSIVIKKNFVTVSFIMLIISDCSSLYYAACNGFDDEYTLLFFIATFASTLFFERLSSLLKFNAFIFTLLVFSILNCDNYNYRILLVLFI